ncbi:hypothetical protein AC579_2693, partial [Lecanosticta acicola]
MANSTTSDLIGACVAPFLDESKFGTEGGYITGRFCNPIDALPGKPTCCLPCPATEWAYSDNFNTSTTAAQWLNVVGLVLMAFMLLSYILLPAQQTSSHYLSVCLIVSIVMITLGNAIPLAANPDQCYDEITPNDMYSLTECAWSGAFIIAGGLTTDMWIFIRALSMNLQICWDIVPGKKFFYISQLLGWGIPAILFTTTLTLTGVSFRFGTTCQINHHDSMGDFWGLLLVMAGAAALLQLVTFGYCIHVYLRNLWTEDTQTTTSASGSGLPSYQGSMRAQTARAVYRRLKKVLWLQWRGICICCIILVDVIFFSVVFVSLDGMQTSVRNDFDKVEPWLVCLAAHPDDKAACLHLVAGWLVNESTVIAVVMLLSLAGVQVFLLLTRPSVFPAWWDLIRSPFSSSRQEFVSLDARPEIMRGNSQHQVLRYQRGHQATTFEMQPKPPTVSAIDLDHKALSTLDSPDDIYEPPLAARRYPSVDDSTSTLAVQQRGRLPPEYVGRITPSPSAATDTQSRPRGAPRDVNDYFTATGVYHAVSWDPRDLVPRGGAGGLGLNPPIEAGEEEDGHD